MSQINWDEKACQHAGNCVKGLPKVFKIENGSFVIDASAATADEIKEVVASCPSGALEYQD